MSKRVCAQPGCATLIDKSGYCPDHARERDKARGTKQQRGYGLAHSKERARWARILARTPVPCARCGEPILVGDAWHLDHEDDRLGYLGPSHATCNLSAAGKVSHKYR